MTCFIRTRYVIPLLHRRPATFHPICTIHLKQEPSTWQNRMAPSSRSPLPSLAAPSRFSPISSCDQVSNRLGLVKPYSGTLRHKTILYAAPSVQAIRVPLPSISAQACNPAGRIFAFVLPDLFATILQTQILRFTRDRRTIQHSSNGMPRSAGACVLSTILTGYTTNAPYRSGSLDRETR